MDNNDNNSKFLSGIIGGIIGAIATLIALALIIFMIYKMGYSNGSNNTTTNNNNAAKSNNTLNASAYSGLLEESENEHVIGESKLKFVPTSDMVILTKSQIEEFMGEGYSNYYEFVAVNQDITKIIYCFQIDKTTEEDYTAEQYLQESLQKTNYGEIKKQTIAGIEFAMAQLVHEEDGKNYLEECYVYKYNNKLLCIDFWHTDAQENNLAEMLQKVE